MAEGCRDAACLGGEGGLYVLVTTRPAPILNEMKKGNRNPPTPP